MASAECHITVIFVIICLVCCDNSQKAGTKDKKSAPAYRDRSHIHNILQLDSTSTANSVRYKRAESAIRELINIYHSDIKPLEDIYHFPHVSGYHVTDGELTSKPLVLFVGPWSTGKTSMINYLVGLEDSQYQLHVGAEPTTTDFNVVMHGSSVRSVEGMVLAADATRGFSSLEKYGQGFLEKFQGLELPYKLLEKVTLVDTPGIIENRKQQERGYPFNDVMKWFIDRADLICVVFDPTKLDVGAELELLFKQLKGRESQIRIILNKADSLSGQELMRVYGALFWGLAPLINVTEPPRVYTGSFWGQDFRTSMNVELFKKEEVSLLQDLHATIANQIENRIAFVRQHAIRVRIHALLVDSFLSVFNNRKSIFGDQESLLTQIVEQPDNFHVFQSILALPQVSKYDLPAKERYKEFFSVYALNAFKSLEQYCSFLHGCPMEHLLSAISQKLPGLLNTFLANDKSRTCDNPDQCKQTRNP